MTAESIFETINSILPEISISQTGVVSFTRASVCRLLGIDPSNIVIGKMPKKLAERLSRIGSPLNEAGSFSYNDNLPIEAVKVIAEYYSFDARKCSVNARKLYNYLSGSVAHGDKNVKPVKTSPEKLVQMKLHSKLGGEMEVVTVSGIIDILTATEIIEVKQAKGWKAAIGQIMVYGCDYPSHKKRLHLFGKCHTKFKEMVEGYCKKFDINVTWDS